MMPSLVTIVALGVILLAGNFLLRRIRTPGRPHVPLSGGVVIMRVPKRHGILLGVCALFPAGLLFAIATRALASPGGLVGAIGTYLAALAVLAVSAHQFASAFKSRFLVDEFGLSRVGVLTHRRVRWGEVAKVVFNPQNRWFFLTTADGSHLWIPIDANGIGDFAEVALSRLPPSSLSADALARDALKELAAR